MNRVLRPAMALASACLVLIAAGAAFAQSNPGKEPIPHTATRDEFSFTAVDTDHDGRISAAEAAFEPGLWRDFARFDADGDLRLSHEEFARWKQAHLGEKAGPRLLLPPH